MYLNSVNQLNSMQPHDVKVYMNDSAHSKTLKKTIKKTDQLHTAYNITLRI